MEWHLCSRCSRIAAIGTVMAAEIDLLDRSFGLWIESIVVAGFGRSVHTAVEGTADFRISPLHKG